MWPLSLCVWGAPAYLCGLWVYVCGVPRLTSVSMCVGCPCLPLWPLSICVWGAPAYLCGLWILWHDPAYLVNLYGIWVCVWGAPAYLCDLWVYVGGVTLLTLLISVASESMCVGWPCTSVVSADSDLSIIPQAKGWSGLVTLSS